MVASVVGIAIKMIEVFQKRKIEGFFDVKVLFALGKFGGEVDGELFVADRMLELTFVFGL